MEISTILSFISSGVFSPLITSTNFMTGAGLKKCMPITGRSRPAPISVIEREDVLVANMQSAFTISCSSLNVCFFTSITSKAASTIKSQSPQISLVPVVILARIASAAACSILPLAILFSNPLAILFLPFAANSLLMSHKQTSYPSVCANACAIPEPMVPAPIIPTFMIRLSSYNFMYIKMLSFFMIRMANKTFHAYRASRSRKAAQFLIRLCASCYERQIYLTLSITY